MRSYLVFQPVQRYFKKIANSDHISVWKANGLFDESIKPLDTSNDRNCLKQDKVTFPHKRVVNIYILYEINCQRFDVRKLFSWRSQID